MGRESTAGTAQHARELPSFRRPRARGERRRPGQLPNRPRRHDVLLGAPGARRRLHHGDLVAAGTRVLRWRGGRMPDSSSAVLVSGPRRRRWGILRSAVDHVGRSSIAPSRGPLFGADATPNSNVAAGTLAKRRPITAAAGTAPYSAATTHH